MYLDRCTYQCGAALVDRCFELGACTRLRWFSGLV